ncbi:MAG: hypothetical protein PHS95_03410 [Candidatus Pacebacteria bacterium]|nr:hypothetical protein [Candidatus Paceibacterota bacterium]
MEKEHNQDNWEKVRESSKEIKNSINTLLGYLSLAFVMILGIWQLSIICQKPITFGQATLISVGILLIYAGKSWWSHRKQAK